MIKIIRYAWNGQPIAVRPWNGLSINKRWQYMEIDKDIFEYVQDMKGHVYYKTSMGEWCKWCNNYEYNFV